VGGNYHLGLVCVSLLVAVLSSYTALDLAARIRTAPARYASWWLAGGALALGTGMWSMHFIGMLAMEWRPPLTYALLPTAASWGIAVLLGATALMLHSSDRPVHMRVTIGGATLGLGFIAMHYTAMQGLQLSAPIHYGMMATAIPLTVAAAFSACGLAIESEGGNGPWRITAALILGSAMMVTFYGGIAAAVLPPDAVPIAEGGLRTSTMASLVAGFSACGLSLALSASHFDDKLRSDASLMRARSKEFISGAKNW